MYLYRWDMSVPSAVYLDAKARSLKSLQENCKHATKPCTKHLGSLHPPLLHVEPSQIVVDELQLLLRIGDILIRNLILEADSQAHRQREHEDRQRGNGMQVKQLERLFRECGVSFRIFQVICQVANSHF